MLRRAKGATIDEIAEALSWQPHTVRGAIAGALKKKLVLQVTSEKDESASASTELLSDQPRRQRPAVWHSPRGGLIVMAMLFCIGSTCYVVGTIAPKLIATRPGGPKHD